MPTVGDRVIVEGTKVGQQRREGSLLRLVGPLIEVQWSDGTQSLFRPGAGSVTFLPGGRKVGSAGARKRVAGAAGNARTAGSRKTGVRKPPAKTKRSQKR